MWKVVTALKTFVITENAQTKLAHSARNCPDFQCIKPAGLYTSSPRWYVSL